MGDDAPKVVLGTCPWCSERYTGAVHARCPACRGDGVIAAPVVEGLHPAAGLRAAVMHLGWPGSDIVVAAAKTAALRKAGLLVHPVPSDAATVIVPPEADTSAKSAIGRAAGKLLITRGLRPAPPPRQPADRLTAAEKRKRAADARQAAEAAERALEERRKEAQRRKARLAAALALAEQHPEEYEAEVEVQEVFVGLEHGFQGFTPDVVIRGRRKVPGE